MRAVFLLCAVFLPAVFSARTIKFTNRCPHDIWISPLTNNQGPELAPGIVRLGGNADFAYQIPDGGWGGRFWPKQGCDGSGHNCEVGQSMPPCLPTGCDPPAETKVEFFFPPLNNGNDVWYDVSLVDGYSLSAEIVPSSIGGSCTRTRCAVSLDRCPTDENHVGDLRVVKNGRTVQCLSPCKKWNYPPPFGHGRDELNEPGLWLCCPTPPTTPEQCRQRDVIHTKFVDLVHRECPTAYSYSYDDEAGLHNCPNNVNFDVTFCA